MEPKWTWHRTDGDMVIAGTNHVYSLWPQCRVYEIKGEGTGVVVPGQMVRKFPTVDAAKKYVEAVAELRA